MNHSSFQTQVPIYYYQNLLSTNFDSFYSSLTPNICQQHQYFRNLYHLRQYLFQPYVKFVKAKDFLLNNIKIEAENFTMADALSKNMDFIKSLSESDQFINQQEQNLPELFDVKVDSCKLESDLSVKTNNIQVNHSLNMKSLKDQISEILEFFIHSHGKISQNDIENQRVKYAQNASLLQVLDVLSHKYSQTSKSREDMIRLLIRKALTFMRNTLRQQLNLNNKQANLTLCKKFFLRTSFPELRENEVEDEILDFFLPYKKNSRNKTPNARFLEEVFLSEDFLKAYVKFLSKLDEIMKLENQKKRNKFVDFIYECVFKHNIQKIKDYKRLPWLNSWIETMKIIAFELLEKNVTYKKTSNNIKAIKE